MDIEKLIACLSKEAYGSDFEELLLEAATALSTLQAENEKLRAESIMHHNAADNYWHELNEYRQERNEALAELEQVKHALAMMWFAYVNSDKETPHSYETEALEEAERLLGPWAECMPKYLRCGQRED